MVLTCRGVKQESAKSLFSVAKQSDPARQVICTTVNTCIFYSSTFPLELVSSRQHSVARCIEMTCDMKSGHVLFCGQGTQNRLDSRNFKSIFGHCAIRTFILAFFFKLTLTPMSDHFLKQSSSLKEDGWYASAHKYHFLFAF